ncbi:permease for cytosine/purines, uracil, thiamine, allantoin-domain-containing protein [Aspergillus pseudodeflectus]|uniref:Permease for cytosine/purines, uracil, thiamine, allantoin-domain-containing protein n=1 Tax=Aspergillus pseudodeflectus TaxID=176178 RepID=A0ABR4K5P1_9EURO
MDPVPFKDRTWAWYDVGGFWISEGFQIPILQMAGSLIANGLSPGMAMGAVVVGNVLVMVPCALNGYAGAATGVNFPVISRASWGLHGAKLAVAIRAIVAVFWYGIQISTGGSCVYRMLAAIWPSLPRRIPNHLPASSNTTSADLLCFFIFWLLTLPFLAIPVSRLRWLFRAKLLLMPITGLVLFIWALVRAHGFGPIFNQPSTPKQGYSTAFLFFSAITSTLGPQATFALNMGDFCRYSKNPRYTLYAQALMMPLCLTLTAFLGVVLASSSTTIFALQEPEWDPLSLLGHFSSRAAQFFVALLFAFATLCTNIAGNSVAFGNDLASLFPRHINIRRGQFLCAILGVAVTPWNILNSATNLLNFLNGYAVFLGPLCGILLADYWILRRRRIRLGQLYQQRGGYWYTRGWNLRAVGSFFLALVPNLPGLAKSVTPGITGVPRGFEDVYTMSWVVGLVIAGVLYLGSSYLFPGRENTSAGHFSLGAINPVYFY